MNIHTFIPTDSGREVENDVDVEQYLRGIGDRVRAIRVRRGMTRRLLSEHSHISERYLSQVESGKANTSVSLLWRIAQGMDVRIGDLLPQSNGLSPVSPALAGLLQDMGPAQQEAAYSLLREHLASRVPDRGIALVGLRGAGKSELGRLLGRDIGLPFVNLVAVAEELSGMQVGELFSLGGQNAYGRMERQALEHVLRHYPRAIVEAGGSLVTRSDTYQRLRRNYCTVWLKAQPDEHMERVVAQGDFRPMQGNDRAMEDLRSILTEREPNYRAAHYTLDTSGRTIKSCLSELTDVARRHLPAERETP